MNWEASKILGRLNESGGSIAEILDLLQKLCPRHPDGSESLWCLQIAPSTGASELHNLNLEQFQTRFKITSAAPTERVLVGHKVRYGFEMKGDKLWFELNPVAGYVTVVLETAAEPLIYLSFIGWTARFN